MCDWHNLLHDFDGIPHLGRPQVTDGLIRISEITWVDPKYIAGICTENHEGGFTTWVNVVYSATHSHTYRSPLTIEDILDLMAKAKHDGDS